jgi:hypothetical protein
MTTDFRAIDTAYGGYLFRSRLEARWAVFFDVLALEWVYEPEGYDLGALGYYLPDFKLRSPYLWVEVKAGAPTDEEIDKIEALAHGSQRRALLVSGDPLNAVWRNASRHTRSFQQTGLERLAQSLGTPFPLIVQAATAARQARFEHGANGAPSGVWTHG